MPRRPNYQQMVTPKGTQGLAALLQSKWKVTSRYTLHLSKNKTVQCIRVSSMTGTVLHLSQDEFHRLFHI